MSDCRACSARREARAPVPFDGVWGSPLFLVGRNPGKVEDQEGRPFVGRSGAYLTRRLRVLAGIDRSKCMVMNMVLCHTEGDRPPTGQEVSICMKRWLIPVLRAVRPRLVVAFGDQVMQALTGRTLREGRLRVWNHREGFGVVVCVHPSAAVRGRDVARFEEDIRFLALVVRQLGLEEVLI